MSAGQVKPESRPGTDREPAGFFEFQIEFKLQFLEANRIPDHHGYIVDRVNLNIDRARFSYFSVSVGFGWAVVVIRSYVIGINHKSCSDKYSRYIREHINRYIKCNL